MNKEKNSKFISGIMIIAVVFICYNAVLFLISGFTGHGTAFWLSYIMMLIAFLTVGLSINLFKANHKKLRDWLLGLPVLKHSVIYLAVELILSIIFMIIDTVWGVAFGIQLITLAIHLVFVISCFMAKETMDEINESVRFNTYNMDKLSAEFKRIAMICEDAEIKDMLSNLAERFRYSDPVSNSETLQFEQELLILINEIENETLACNKEAVTELCKKTSILLERRNTNCKLYKQNRF